MAFNALKDLEETQSTALARSCVVMIEFSADAFGPVKALQLFAAINELPTSSLLSADAKRGGWSLVLAISLSRPVERVLSKIQSMPAVRQVTREDIDASGFEASRSMSLFEKGSAYVS